MAVLRQQQAGGLGGSSKLSPSHHSGIGGGGAKLPGADPLPHPGLAGSVADMHQKSLGPYSGLWSYFGHWFFFFLMVYIFIHIFIYSQNRGSVILILVFIVCYFFLLLINLEKLAMQFLCLGFFLN